MSSQTPEATNTSPPASEAVDSAAQAPAPGQGAQASAGPSESGLSKTTNSRRLLEEDAPIAPTESTQAWFAQGAAERLQRVVKLVAARPQRKPFSHASQKTAEAMQTYLRDELRGVDVSFVPMAGAAPRRPPAFWYLVAAAALTLLAPVQMSLFLLLYLVLLVGVCLEFAGVMRFSRLCWPPRGGYLVEAKESPQRATQEEHQTLVLWAALDTPPADVVYHPARFASMLEPLHKARVLPSLILLGVLALGFLLLWWWTATTGSAAGWLAVSWAVITIGLAVGVGWLYESSQERGIDAAAVAVAVEAFQRLQKLSLGVDLRLVLVGASHTHVGIESWLRQRSPATRRQETLLMGVMPLGGRQGQLAYATHHGFLWPLPMASEMTQLGDWTAARLASLATESHVPGSSVPGTIPKFEAQRWHGSTPGFWAQRFGVKSVVIGDSEASVAAVSQESLGHALHPDEAVQAISTDALDTAAAFLVVLAQAQAHEREAAEDGDA